MAIKQCTHLSPDVCTLTGKMVLSTQLPYLSCACGLGRRAENEKVQKKFGVVCVYVCVCVYV